LAEELRFQEKNARSPLRSWIKAINRTRVTFTYWVRPTRGKGDAAKAKESFTKAAKFNSLPLLNYASVRTKAEKRLPPDIHSSVKTKAKVAIGGRLPDF
jgi:hypothetical protein